MCQAEDHTPIPLLNCGTLTCLGYSGSKNENEDTPAIKTIHYLRAKYTVMTHVKYNTINIG